MAVVLILSFFVLASFGTMFSVMTGDTSSIAAFLGFSLLAWGLFGGLFKMARDWDHEPEH
jgi:hypothetical protein